jgi:DNA ligase-associated metallophosphoesterase
VKDLELQHLQQKLYLSPYKTIFWAQQHMLILSDLHLGKAAHFRKHGMAIPNSVHLSDFNRLELAIDQYKPKQVLILGDLFHSRHNKDWERWINWMGVIKNKVGKFVLVKGNHDILEDNLYAAFDLVVDTFTKPPYIFTHEKTKHESLFNLYGHIHPGISVKGKGRQSIKLPCFYFGKRHGILPAFGNFTGIYQISYKFDDQIFAITDNSVVKLRLNK